MSFADDPRITPEMVAHSNRFREVANQYPLLVTYAYGGDIAAAATDDDETIAAKVAEWERRQGREPADWHAVGEEERDDAEEFDELFGQVCDVVERTYQRMPLDDDSGIRLTSTEARAAAVRIFEILAVDWPEERS